MEAKKNDFKDGKLRWDLLPLEEIEDIVEVYTAGSKKYGDNNWQHLKDGYQRYKAAMFRHLLEYEKGNKVDEETGCQHLAQVAWNAIAMLWVSKHEFREATVGDLSKALDERIKEKIDACNVLLDGIQLSSEEEMKRRSEFTTISGMKKDICKSIRELSKKLAKETDFNFWLHGDETEAMIEEDKGNMVKYIPSNCSPYSTNKEIISNMTDYKNKLKEFVEKIIYEYNEGKFGTGDDILSEDSGQVQE